MKVVALVSGGKDSCYAMMKCIHYGHQIVALANLLPADDAKDELDSYMYQTVGHQIVIAYAKCMGIPLFRRRIQGSTRHYDLSYQITPGDEVEDMFILLNEVKQQIPSIEGVSSGAIASDYQRLRVESVCSRLGLVSLAYLWKQDQSYLLQEMITSGIVAITVKVAAIGLDPSKHLGKEIVSLVSHLHKLKELYGVNVCGEGGEYETLTLDCPLFKNARIMLDKSEVIYHSSDAIAPVAILHPLAFHLETKLDKTGDENQSNYVLSGELESVYEVKGDCLEKCEGTNTDITEGLNTSQNVTQRLHISETKNDTTFSISCWLEDPSMCSTDLREDLELVLTKLEMQLAKHCYTWEHVLYIHLYISDMNKFAIANDTYVKFITQEKCRFGVPSRSTLELPLSQTGFGHAYIEVLVANDNTKKVLHVQSISSWAPSCIGPYSQATLHKEVIYMAGQLGLDPPTMVLCNGGAIAELEQALANSEAVAKSFNCSISTSAMLFIIYCSSSISTSERFAIEEKKQNILKQIKLLHLDGRNTSEVLDPMFLCVFVPDLPKRALVEVKPMLYVPQDSEIDSGDVIQDLSNGHDYWGFQQEDWHDSCIQKCIIQGKICAAVINVTDVVTSNICTDFQMSDCAGMENQIIINRDQMERIARFFIYSLDKILSENQFSWNDILSLRFYFTTRLPISRDVLSCILCNAFGEFDQMSQRVGITTGEPIFNLIPVVSAGRYATSADDLITCELFSRKH